MSTKPCAKCKECLPLESFSRNASSKDGRQPGCKSCRAEIGKRYRAANPEKVAEATKRYREANVEKVAEATKRYREANPEKIAAGAKRWREANPEKIAAGAKRWREANPEKVAEATKRWREANVEKVAARRKHYQGTLPDNYIARLLTEGTNLRPSTIPKELIRVKRTHLLLVREIKKATTP